jgi:hypothetical protein
MSLFNLFNGFSVDYDFDSNKYLFVNTETEAEVLVLDDVTMEELLNFVKQTKEKIVHRRHYKETHPITIDGVDYTPIDITTIEHERKPPQVWCDVCDLKPCSDIKVKIPYCRRPVVAGGRLDNKDVIWRKVTK